MAFTEARAPTWEGRARPRGPPLPQALRTAPQKQEHEASLFMAWRRQLGNSSSRRNTNYFIYPARRNVVKMNDREMFLRPKTFPDFTCGDSHVHIDICPRKYTIFALPKGFLSHNLKAAERHEGMWAGSPFQPAVPRKPPVPRAEEPQVKTSEWLEKAGGDF